MTDRLDELATSHGIQTRYISELGEDKAISDEAKAGLLRVLGIDPEAGARGRFDEAPHAATLVCALPGEKRLWGVTCQLYALRSARSLGLGDFEDLAALAEIGAKAGANFVGVNPLHALFLADPGRYSPYSPSTRRFINPFYIAVDRLDGGEAAIAELKAAEPALFDRLSGDLVDYAAAGSLKRRLLRTLYDRLDEPVDEAFEAFRTAGGAPLRNFALFEAISAAQVAAGNGTGWHGWSEDLHHLAGEGATAFARDNAAEIRFHEWLQFVADSQLAHAQERALAAGMSLGLYLDFAVGVSPDGADTWADPQLTTPDARVGSPPDMFNSDGQDWGLAPLSPEALATRDYRPLADAYGALMAHAGAVRIDHAMGLARLWWIPTHAHSRDGGYVRYPLGAMIDTVARASQDNACVVIGEDLGTVPAGFRPAAEAAGILSYRVLYFERREGEGFLAPGAYPQRSLACISTHDLATLAGWWTGSDITLRQEAGRQDEAATERSLRERGRDRSDLLDALAREGLPAEDEDELSEAMAVSIHRFAARTNSQLFAVQLDDMIGATRQPNLPGTTDEYPNWRIRCELPLEAVADNTRFQMIARALREERPEAE
ncbi:4-alpha-glucanotransferase [Aureimonas mangrovi]|uniref:4-alpha-glucanotransferase n=1 Tax=Aureimonas mangrovi TaxID=2758041 RepID=UPI00163D8971|nr:4-alpha-glucanotransferase [Aureimonas mangrovi]